MTGGSETVREDEALGALLGLLVGRGYRHVTVTPASHARIVARPDRARARRIEDVLGWSLPFAPGLDPAVEALLDAGGVAEDAGALRRAAIRVSSLYGRLYLHSAYPTSARDAVFFGPDSYRFADLIVAELTARPPRRGARIVDIGSGAGVGAVVAADACPDARVTMTDINPAALRLAGINAAAAGHAIAAVQAAGLDGVVPGESLDVVLINPPYIIDDDGRRYRDGGGMHGGALALDLARAALARLAPGGRLILYTGAAIVTGGDALYLALAAAAAEQGCTLRYRELDPDVFGEELERPAYAEVDRIALVSAIFTRPD